MSFAPESARMQNPARRSRPPVLAEYVLDSWVELDGPRGGIDFDRFAPRVGMTVEGWHRMFYRARHDGDRRAVRPARKPPEPRSREDLLARWVELGGPDGLISRATFADQVGVTYEAWRSTLKRARKDNDPRATLGRAYLRGVQ